MIANPVVYGDNKEEYVTANVKIAAYDFAFMAHNGIVVNPGIGTYQVLKNSICTISPGAAVSDGAEPILNSVYGEMGYKVVGDFEINFGEPS